MPAADEQKESTPPNKFWDSLWALGLLIGAVLLARMYILEPFKIPSGSMEPTLFGHEDYGDRILTNKLAYVSMLQLGIVTAVSLLVILASLAWSIMYSRIYDLKQHTRSIVITLLLAAATAGLIGLGWARDAVAGDPRRFDVVVFQYNTDWFRAEGKGTQDVNYIKRLIGLPGEWITVAGGDLFMRKSDSDPWQILRKWKDGGQELQEQLWYPVSKGWQVPYRRPAEKKPGETTAPLTPDEEARQKTAALVRAEIDDMAFPWSGAEAGTTRNPKSLSLDGTADVKLAYKFPVTNVYIKQGRWRFIHKNCPAAHLPSLEGPEGLKWRNPLSTTEDITAYVANTWEGVQCPNCGEVMFPLTLKPDHAPEIFPEENARFIRGGDFVVGDVRLDVDLDVEQSGAVQIEVGSTLHRALWKIPSGAAAADTDTVHPVQAATPELTPGPHRLSLRYVDGTVVALLDGREVERRELDGLTPPRLSTYRENAQSVVSISLTHVKGTLTRLDVYRDLFHTPGLPAGPGGNFFMMSEHERYDSSHNPIRFNEEDGTGNYVAHVPKGEYLMMGDNSPSSSDGRVWGFVPRARLVGRAWVVWWPPSRWRLIK